jgi:hypothetical protein
MTDYPVGPTQLNQSQRVVIHAKAMRFEVSFRGDAPDANAETAKRRVPITGYSLFAEMMLKMRSFSTYEAIYEWVIPIACAQKLHTWDRYAARTFEENSQQSIG